MPGIKIGDGAIVASRSVVTHEVPPYAVVSGNPAHPRKRRFDDELIELLLAFRWWDLPPEELIEVLPLLCSSDLDQIRLEIRRRFVWGLIAGLPSLFHERRSSPCPLSPLFFRRD